MKLKDFIDLEEAVDMSDVFTSHMKVMKDISGGMSTANFEKLERMIKRSSNTSVKKNDFI